MKVIDIAIDKIKEPSGVLRIEPNDTSIQRLAASIKTIGLINPITAKELPAGNYEIIAGHRRYLACKAAGLKTITCNVVTKDEKTTDAMKIIENMHRKSLTTFEEIMAMADYAEKHKLSVDDFCDTFQISKSTAIKYMTLVNTQQDLQMALHAGTINMEQALELMKIKDDTERMQWTKQCIELKWSAKQLKSQIELAKSIKEANEAFAQNREHIENKIEETVTYIHCDFCGRKMKVEDMRTWAVCQECSDSFEEARLRYELEQKEKKNAAE